YFQTLYNGYKVWRPASEYSHRKQLSKGGCYFFQVQQILVELQPPKSFVIIILSIVPHAAAKVEQLFSDLGGTQSAKRCYHIHLKN
ncbi:hypothetical protein EV702DRAFT_1010336, partial [Suillus placidus]